MTFGQDPRSLPDLVSDLGGEAANLVRAEAQLLRTEMTEKLVAAMIAAAKLLAGGLFLMVALLILLQALVAWLAESGMGFGLASLVVGLGVAVIGAVLVVLGLSALKSVRIAPDRTIDQLENDARTVKETIR